MCSNLCVCFKRTLAQSYPQIYFFIDGDECILPCSCVSNTRTRHLLRKNVKVILSISCITTYSLLLTHASVLLLLQNVVSGIVMCTFQYTRVFQTDECVREQPFNLGWPYTFVWRNRKLINHAEISSFRGRYKSYFFSPDTSPLPLHAHKCYSHVVSWQHGF